MIHEIASRSNPRVRALAAELDGLYVYEGDRLVRDLLARREPLRLLVAHHRHRQLALNAAAENIWLTDRPVLDRLSRLRDAPDLIAVIPPPKPGLNLERAEVVVVLDRVQDPANAGTAFRCAAAFGLDGMVLAGDTVRPWNPRFMRAAQTSLLDVPFQILPGLDELFSLKQASHFNVYLTAAAPPAERGLSPGEMRIPCLVVVGHEGRGIDHRWFFQHPVVHIPQSGLVDSLNAGVSACILMYELQRSGKIGVAER
ncbi:MAG TPA: RNA methyltransferase [Candidatus Aminicenantes bacterium]|nr:RNA methyltransferase [Candidatus Aminicenantes bacterium]